MEGTGEVAFGNRLRRLRRDAGLTQEQLAELAGLSVRALGDLERGMIRVPYRATVQQLAGALSLSPEASIDLLNASRRRAESDPARPASLTTIPANSTIGREREIAAVEAFLTRLPVRLVTLTGPGGVGKTRLALEVARRLRALPMDSVFIVPLAPLLDPALLAPTIVQALGVHERCGRPAWESLVTYLRDRKAVLLLDNFEHLLAAAELVAELLAHCPVLRMLITSRAPLHLQGEQEYPVQPLPAPAPDEVLSPQRLLRYPAVELFVQRAMATQPDFRLDQANGKAVASICQRLDGLPLAIELAAARTKVFPPQALLEHLTGERGTGAMRLLAGRDRDRPPRLQTMRNAIAWTFQDLNPAWQVLFGRLAVFAGGATLDAIGAVCGGGNNQDVLEGVADLVDQSLLRTEEQLDGEARFVMLEVIREYALEWLETQGEVEALRARHSEHYLAWAEKTAAGLSQRPDQAARLARLDREHGNLRMALSWMRQTGAGDSSLRLAIALGDFWQVRGYAAEGSRWLEQALQAGATDLMLRAKALHALGILVHDGGDYGRAVSLLAEAIDHFKQLDDSSGAGRALLALAYIAHDQGEYRRSADLYTEALELFQARGDMANRARALTELASVHADQEEFELARELYTEGLAASREMSDTRAVAIAMLNLGDLAVRQGDYERAIELFTASIEMHRTLGDDVGIALGLLNLGEATWLKGDCTRAAPFLIESLTLSHRLDHKRTLAYCLLTLAAFTAARGTAEAAARLWGAAEALCETMDIAIPSCILTRYQSYLAGQRAMLGEEAWALTVELGRAMTIERAVECALKEHGPLAAVNRR